jgi:hypothetical protein
LSKSQKLLQSSSKNLKDFLGVIKKSLQESGEARSTISSFFDGEKDLPKVRTGNFSLSLEDLLLIIFYI